MPLSRFAPLLLTVCLGGTACGEPPREGGRVDAEGEASPGDASVADTPAAAASATDRSTTRTDTLSIEGMREPISLRLFQTPEGFPLPFAAYVPEDMDPRVDPSEGTAHFTAEFGGTRNEEAFVHLYVFPDDTPLHEAVATARGYTAGRSGIPVSTGMDPATEEGNPPPEPNWALESFRFHYQGGESWLAGAVGVGRHGQRHYMIVRHYPVEYADGFGPRADLILATWRWADGSRLRGSERSGR